MTTTKDPQTTPTYHRSFPELLQSILPLIESKCRQCSQAAWLLETTGSQDAASLQADLETETRTLLGDKARFAEAKHAKTAMQHASPEQKRCYNVWMNLCAPHCVDPALLRQIAEKEAKIRCIYANFRPELEGKRLSEEDIRNHLKNELQPKRRKQIWALSKEIGSQLAPDVLAIVDLRNQSARSVGYKNYFDMQLQLQEVDSDWLFKFLDEIATRSDAAYTKLLDEVNQTLAARFHVPTHELGPWSWSEPFCQEDPLAVGEMDACLEGVDICGWTTNFYDRMGFDVRAILERSDLYPREGKNQHAFCTHIDRSGDIRTLNNITPSMRWLETLLHELGHAVYEEGFDKKLPWLLKEPPHMITTEAMALLMGRQAYRASTLKEFPHATPELIKEVEASAKRRQLIFSRWVLVMTHFEKELYSNPSQDLNSLWWSLVERYQKVKAPEGRAGKCDWAAKYHVAMAPVYYYSYLLGELFASSLENLCRTQTGQETLALPTVGKLLNERLFFPGNRMSWKETIEDVLKEDFSATPWIEQFAPSAHHGKRKTAT